MEIKIGDSELKIEKNNTNGVYNYFSPNHSYVKINGEWYRCFFQFRKEGSKIFLEVKSPYKTDKLFRVTETYMEGIYKEFRVSRITRFRIEWGMNHHRWNYKLNRWRLKISQWIKKISPIPFIVGVVSFIISRVVPKYSWWELFTNIGTIVGLFVSMTIKKQPKQRDIVVDMIEQSEKKRKEEEKKEKYMWKRYQSN